MMAILNFTDYSDVKKWGAIEAESPGGLTDEALAFITPSNTHSMDLIWHGSAPSFLRAAKPSFFSSLRLLSAHY